MKLEGKWHFELNIRDLKIFLFVTIVIKVNIVISVIGIYFIVFIIIVV